MPYTATVSLCSQGRNGPYFWMTTVPGSHVTQHHHPACEPLLVGGDGGADDEQQHQPTTNIRDNSGTTNRGMGANSRDDNVGTMMQGQQTPGNKWGQQ